MFTAELDKQLKSGFGVRGLKTPVRAPTANAFCERMIGSIRRDCMDHVIPINERHVRLVMKEFVNHYNRGRPHMSLGPGIPEPLLDEVSPSVNRHDLPDGYRVEATPVLGGLHHEYHLKKAAA